MIDLQETERLKNLIEQDPTNYKSIIESTTLAICITDENGIFVDVNQNYCSFYGYKKEELVGHSFLLVVPEDNKNQLQNLHDKFIEIQVELFRTWQVQKKNGEIAQISVDAGYTDKISGRPYKLTFVQPL